ncbi:MAG TPA: peptidoglycan-associated lipoprotein Pal [Burkholderiaceae bacterium]|nr:peptidoglycan-associated lipoprotein Pal [Burkholderiaceae bacterium]
MTIKSLSIALIAAAALAACSSTPIDTKAPVASASTAPPATPPAASTAQSSVATVTLDPLDDPKSQLAARSVYFAYDDFTVDPKYQPLVQAHGQFLQTHAAVQIRVEGNADERGSREYNLALGDKRAQIVAKQLELMGAKPAQIEAVSYGEERPKAEGHDEAAWAENRRADIRYVKR